MESLINTYKLNQEGKEYILTISTIGENIKISCKSTLNENANFSQDFSLNELKKLDQLFGAINTTQEALEYLDKALKVQKVGVVEEKDSIKINFYITSQKNIQNIEIPSISSNQEFNSYDMNQNITLEQTTAYDNIYQKNQNNYIEGIDSANQYIETVDSSADILQNLNLNSAEENITTDIGLESQYVTRTEDLSAQYTTGGQDFQDYTVQYTPGDLTEQYSDTTNTQYVSEYETTNYNVPNLNNNNYLDSFQTTTETVETTTNYYQPEQAYDTQPYITPVENIDTNYAQPSSFQSTNFYEQTTTTKQTLKDDRIEKLMGDTNSLKNEHQLIQDKLTALSEEMNAYKTKLELIEKKRTQNEINKLRAENMAIKQQLSELNNLRNDAAEVRVLRSQLSQLDPLRQKVSQMENLRSQLSELNALREKAAGLNAAKTQLGELNSLRAQASQMGILRQQLEELKGLKAKLTELNGVKSQLDELRNLRVQVNQIEVLKQQIKELGSLKDNAVDAENLKRKIAELEAIKLQYEKEIRNLRESQSHTQTLEIRKLSETKIRNTGMDSKQLLFEDRPQQICVKGDIIHNTDELGLLTSKINKLNQKLTLNLLYKATADSDKASAFHDKCDEAKSTLVLVETDKGRRFGGFTTCSWTGDCIDKKDEDAFVFSLDKMEIYENIPGEDAIGCYPKFGPIFLGCQIRIFDDAFTKGGTTFEKGLNYNTEEDFELNGGERTFGVREIEVYEVIPQ